MKLRSVSYVTTHGLKDTSTALDMGDKLDTIMKQWLEQKRITGYSIMRGLLEEDFDDYGLDRELIESVTKGALPFVTLSVTFDRERPDLVAGRPPELEGVVQEYKLHEVAAHPE